MMLQRHSSTGLTLTNVAIRLGQTRLIDLTAEVDPGAVLTVMGASGSGKSTLLSYIGGFLDPAFEAAGLVSVDGTNLLCLAPEARRAGILFQDPLLFPHMSVGANVAFAIPAEISDRRQRRKISADILDEMDLGGFEERDPATLSGGQKARVALARVLVSRPRLLLLDEPFSKLDMDLRSQMRTLVFERARRAGLPVILVTHDEADAEAAGGTVHRIGAANG
ncbi:ATP-binding cassette domain-containing protein [Rhizobium sp. WL3]|jgi:putative thiamine transport system ATP-binding protein|uniref:ATP-binding cassette domain-containing protein n=1 Tax=Rhizobium sp. WL3 TaxID=2603277 RepID=UPI0011C1DE90|nr:ATP-binding cassette domain-containing protein [Rhizobium sp. WL3]QEE47861.1 ATP-binding cassette domain-containing protein [Rhizobium sp. WL3]